MPPIKRMCYELNKDTIIRKINNETVFINMKNGMAMTVDEVGSRIFEEFIKQYDVEKTCDVLFGEYDVQKGQLKNDIMEFVCFLKDNEIIIKNKSHDAKQSNQD